MTSTKVKNLCDALRAIISYFGLPQTIVADNGPLFNAIGFQKICEKYCIKYLNSPPYHPESNGWAERGVRSVKNALKKMISDGNLKKNQLR